jgi:hypothetical protein
MDDSSPLDEMQRALEQAAAGSNSLTNNFRKSFHLIEQYLTAKVSQKVVLDIFNAAYGHKLHPPRFRKMLIDERKRRIEAGEAVVCTTCGHPLDLAENAKDAANKEDVS